MTKQEKIEYVARELANAEFEARLAVIKASWKTKNPISLPGPRDGMDYLISRKDWYNDGVAPIRQEYIKTVRNVFEILEGME